MRKYLGILFTLLMLASFVGPVFAANAQTEYAQTVSALSASAVRVPTSGEVLFHSVAFQPNSCDFTNNDTTNTVYVDLSGATAVTDGSNTTSWPLLPLTSRHIDGCVATHASVRGSGGNVSTTLIFTRRAQ